RRRPRRGRAARLVPSRVVARRRRARVPHRRVPRDLDRRLRLPRRTRLPHRGRNRRRRAGRARPGRGAVRALRPERARRVRRGPGRAASRVSSREVRGLGSRVPSRGQAIVLLGYAGSCAVYVVIGVTVTDFLLSFWVALAYLVFVAWAFPALVRKLR